MNIHSLHFKNSYLGWEVERIEFNQLNLLVGLSGAGKSQILNALWFLRGIALGSRMNDIEWEITFSNEGIDFEWSGKFGKSEYSYNNQFPIIREKIRAISTNQFVERDKEGDITIQEGEGGPQQLPLSTVGSGLLMQIYSDEHPFIRKALQGFKKMVLRDHTLSQADVNLDFYRLRFRYAKEKHGTMDMESIRRSGWTTSERLLIADKNNLNNIGEIKEKFCSIFPDVSDLNIIEIKNNRGEGHLEYQIKAGGSKKWIPHWNISSGMLRVLNYLVEITFADEDTVFLIDEFENSLGHNCLPALSEDILLHSFSQQFIITSHHPDIINEFDMNTWFVVSRTNGRIRSDKASNLPFARSLHEPYLALINYFENTQPTL